MSDDYGEAAIRERTRALLARDLAWEDYWAWLREAQRHVAGDDRLLLYQCIGPIGEFDGGYRDEDELLAHLAAVADGTYTIHRRVPRRTGAARGGPLVSDDPGVGAIEAPDTHGPDYLAAARALARHRELQRRLGRIWQGDGRYALRVLDGILERIADKGKQA